jgi:ATP-dependent Lon protease
LLLLGDPGTGKSRFARRFAELAGLPMRTIGCGGSSDNRDLAGTSKGYSTGEASAVLRAIRDGAAANPVILVDEVEKAGISRHNGHIVDVLLAMLEPETAKSWHDEYLCMAADLSAVNWILSANSLAGLPEPLLNRVTVVRVTAPRPEQLPAILDSLKTEIAKELGVDPFALPEIHSEAERMLEQAFAEGQSIRRIRAALLAAIGASVDGPRMLH